jgi:hypothetical protein
MLEIILSHVPDHLAIAQTCKKFHEISCNVKLLKLQFVIGFEDADKIFDSSIRLKFVDIFGQTVTSMLRPIMIQLIRIYTFFNRSKKLPMKFLDENDIFDSIMNSDRRLKQLKVRGNQTDVFRESRLVRLNQVIERFGNDVTTVEFCSLLLPRNIVELLNLMPNLKIIDLANIVDGDVTKGKLKLRKLKLVDIYSCSDSIVHKIFNQLSPNVLERICLFEIYDQQKIGPLFPNQHNIKEIVTDSDFFDRFEWNQLKLKSLEISDFEDLKNILVGQDEMKKLKCNLTSLKIICDELKSLVELEVYCYRLSDWENSQLWKLKNLKILTFHGLEETASDVNIFLTMIKSSSLEKLDISIYRASLTKITINELAVNLPHLKDFSVYSESSINIINAIVKNFPNLESLEYFTSRIVTDTYCYQDGLTHKNLTSLKIETFKGDENMDLPMLIRNCEKLEYLKIGPRITELLLTEILKVTGLKSLILSNYDKQQITPSFVAALKKHGRKLEFFECRLFYFDGVTETMLREEFKEFKIFVKPFLWNMEKIQITKRQ